MEQEIACASVKQRARGSIPGRNKFPGWGFFGVFPQLYDKYQEALGPQGPRISFFIIILLISALLVWMSEWMMCIVFNVRIVLEVPRHWAEHSSLEVLHVLAWAKKYVCDPKLIPSPDRSLLCKARERKSCKCTYKGEVKWNGMEEEGQCIRIFRAKERNKLSI